MATVKQTAAKPVKVDPERICPKCGEFHASSLVPEDQVGQLEGVKVSALEKAAVYRVFTHGDGVFYVVPHEGGD